MTNEEIVSMNEWLIKKIAKKFFGVEYDDLYQAGVLGMMKAIQNYQKNPTTKFSTYAYDYVYGEMYQMVYKSKQLKFSKDILKLYRQIEFARSSLAQKLKRIPSNLEVALFLEMKEEDVEQILFTGNCVVCSLDETGDEEKNYYETIPKEEQLSIDDKVMLHESLNELNDDEKKIIQIRYFQDYTQSETAKKLHMTQVMVSRYEKKGIEKLRAYYQNSN